MEGEHVDARPLPIERPTIAAKTTPLLMVGLASAWLFTGLSRSGAWDPYEPDTADLARRIAVHAFGAGHLARTGDPAQIPTTADLGMGELPFTSMALSFRLFGVSDWSGRLPLALWGLAGVVSLYFLVARLLHPRAGFYASLALISMPLYFLQARTMLGDIVTISAFAMATSGLALALFERTPLLKLAAFAWGGLGLVAGFMTRGALFGLAAPLLGVGLAALISVPLGRARIVTWLSAALCAGLGAAALIWFVLLAKPIAEAASSQSSPPLLRAVGMVLVDATPADSTFDRLIRQLGHALFPWGGIVLVSLGWLFAPPQAGHGGNDTERASFLKVLLLTSAAISFGASTLVVSWAGALPFAGVAMLAGAVGVMAHELDRTGAARLAGLAAVVLTLVVYVDIDREPARMLASFGVDAAAFPKTFDSESQARTKLTMMIVAVVAYLSFAVEQGQAAGAQRRLPLREVRAAMASWLVSLRASLRLAGREIYEAFQGNLIFTFVVLEAALIGLAGMLFAAGRAGWTRVTKLPAGVTAVGQAAWWAVPLALVLLPLGWVLLRDGYRGLGRVTGMSRGARLMVGACAASALLSFGYFPALAEQLSPKTVFAVFARVAGPNDELALLGTSPRAGALYAKTPVVNFSDVSSAFDWLGSDVEARRFLILKARDLPKLNSQHRARYRRNVAVLDARSSQNVLVTSRLEGAVDQNPFADVVLDELPSIARPLGARFLENIEVLGWETVDERGRPVASVKARKSFKLRLYFRVLKRTPGSWQVFVHIDGNERHQTVDHPPADGRYPMNLWQPGDIIRDEVEVTLEPNWAPGEYWLFFGFFQGTTRLHVSDGPHKEDRIIGGRLTVK